MQGTKGLILVLENSTHLQEQLSQNNQLSLCVVTTEGHSGACAREQGSLHNEKPVHRDEE